ncbi:TPA: hypothetical protein KIA88_003433 [Salmonella enterica]|uniref:Conjugal transfer protein TraP n=1 Tax=Salmonella enterica TaxID=28901 RepID=A0A627Z5C5_SALER|nr:hypothetical protein [Salmonella enterica]EBS6827458.1 hypothetical protein [Salmonella enterica subsp. enterica serovar Manhattan]EBW9653100.1 hypothetical protein [Salmonella enterica subsp. enterica serovar Uganda]EBX2262638.1 hypothetical protein [Salmonella enterica subsp. enterica serovar Newport]EBX2618629.1 hypothetical protein [Salmonella enterica subsp. enterica serovar Sandiego]
MKSHFDPQITAPLPLEDDESEAEATVTSADKPVKRPLWDQPKIQIAALAIFAILGLTWKMSGSSTPPSSQPQFTVTEPVNSPAPVTVNSSPRPEPSPTPQQVAPVTEELPPASPSSETDSLAGEVSRALNSQQVYSEKTREGLAALARRVGNLEQQITELKKQRQETPVAVRQPTVASTVAKPKTSGSTSTKGWSGHRATINSLYPGLAWVTWQGSSWALRPGDRFAGATVLRIDERKREVVTSSGVIR